MAVFDKDEEGVAGLRKHIEKATAKYPALYDATGRNSKALGIRGYPCCFLLDRDGKVIWEGVFQEKQLAELEARIRSLRRKIL